MDNEKTTTDRVDPLLGLDPSLDPLGAREAALSLLGDIDSLAASAMTGTGLDPRVRALIEQYPGAIDPQAFKLKLGFAMAERAVEMADNDPEEAADLLNRAVKVLGARAPSPATLAASTKSPHGFSKAILGALLYSTRLSKDPKTIAAKAHNLIAKIEKEREEAKRLRLEGSSAPSHGSAPGSIGIGQDAEATEEAGNEIVNGLQHALARHSAGDAPEVAKDASAEKDFLPLLDIGAKLANALNDAATKYPSAKPAA